MPPERIIKPCSEFSIILCFNIQAKGVFALCSVYHMLLMIDKVILSFIFLYQTLFTFYLNLKIPLEIEIVEGCLPAHY